MGHIIRHKETRIRRTCSADPAGRISPGCKPNRTKLGPGLLTTVAALCIVAGEGRSQYVEDSVEVPGGRLAVYNEGTRSSQSLRPDRSLVEHDPFCYGAQLIAANGYDRWSMAAGPVLQYSPLPWLVLQVSACYENDFYLFFQHYRVGGALLNADISFRWWHIVASLGANMDYYFAPVAERRIHGWHAYAGTILTSRPGVAITLAVGYVNRVDPCVLGYAMKGWSSVIPTHVLLQDVPRLCLLLSATLRRK